MPLDITFTLSDQDLEHFQRVIDRAKAAKDNSHDAAEIEASARKLITDAGTDPLPDFIAERLAKLGTVIGMLSDVEWQLGDAERDRILNALVYFCDPEDLIPDSVPGIGYLDDAIYVELVLRELKTEVESYLEFCEFRTAEEGRRRRDGLDPLVLREDWLAKKRASLHEEMKKRRLGRTKKGGWRLRW